MFGKLYQRIHMGLVFAVLNSYYLLNFFYRHKPIKIVSSCMSFGKLFVQGLFHLDVKFVGGSQYSFIILLKSLGSVVISSMSFLILVIYALFFFSVILARGLLILLIFSKNQLLLSLIFSIDFLLVFNFIDFCSNSYFLPSAQFGFNLIFLFQFSQVETQINSDLSFF